MNAPPNRSSQRVFRLDDFASCSKCFWSLEPGEVAIAVGDETFCSERCVQNARSAVEHDLGGEAG